MLTIHECLRLYRESWDLDLKPVLVLAVSATPKSPFGQVDVCVRISEGHFSCRVHAGRDTENSVSWARAVVHLIPMKTTSRMKVAMVPGVGKGQSRYLHTLPVSPRPRDVHTLLPKAEGRWRCWGREASQTKETETDDGKTQEGHPGTHKM
jgi:hypothetical protein